MRRWLAAERRSARLLVEQGYTVGSRRHLAGPGDLLGVRVRRYRLVEVVLVEVKATAHPFGGFPPADRAAMLALADELGADVALHYYPPGDVGEPVVFDATTWPA